MREFSKAPAYYDGNLALASFINSVFLTEKC